MKSINPYTGHLAFTNPALSEQDIGIAIEQADDAYRSWRTTPVQKRAKYVYTLSQVLKDNKDTWGRVMSLEMGKPISQAIAEIEKCAWVCEHYADNAPTLLKNKEIKTEATASYVRFDPLGIILGVMPWNYPFWQVFRFAVPTLLAGNTALLKHASNVMESAKCIQQAFDMAGFPAHVFTNLTIGSQEVEAIIRHPKVKGVSLTGSKPAGSAVASIASQEIKPSLLELGGSNALVVFEDCDMEATADICINARFQNTGQSCIAGKRLLVQSSIAKSFLALMVEKVKTLPSGDPLDKHTFIGTMVHKAAAKELHDQLQASVAKGAKILVGGHYQEAYFEPTIVDKVTESMPIFQEETFGPLLACTTFETEAEAVRLVNASEFGLGVSLFTKDTQRIERLIPQLEDGAVFINELVKSDPRLPFGGTKISGFGRELSEEGIMAFVNKKTVYVR